MDIISIIIGLVIGAGISWVIFYLLNKAKNVSKQIYDDLNVKFNDTNTKLQVSEGKLSDQYNEHSILVTKIDTKEKELLDLLPKVSSLETELKNVEKKNAEFSTKLSDQAEANITLQNEINLLKQTLSEEKANNRSLSENILSQKKRVIKN